MRRVFAFLVFLAVLGFVVYAAVVPHAERPCIVTKANPCTKALQEVGK